MRGIAHIFLELLFPKQMMVRDRVMPESDALPSLPVLSVKRLFACVQEMRVKSTEEHSAFSVTAVSSVIEVPGDATITTQT